MFARGVERAINPHPSTFCRSENEISGRKILKEEELKGREIWGDGEEEESGEQSAIEWSAWRRGEPLDRGSSPTNNLIFHPSPSDGR